jgi:hypothetical protein
VDAQAEVLEQVGGLSVDLERILVVEQIRTEQAVGHMPIVIQTDTNTLLVGNFCPGCRGVSF